MHPILFELGSLKLSSYGLMLAIAFFTGIFLAKRQAIKENVSGPFVETLAFWIIVSAIFGARFLYTFIEHGDYYFKYPLKFFSFQQGGLAFFGGLFFAVGASIIYCRKKHVPFWQVADIFTPSIALGLGIAKIGCFLAGCCFGRVCHLPWAIVFRNADTLASPKGLPLHPTQLYESLAAVTIFFGLIYFRRFRRFHGEVFVLFLISYGIVRSFLEVFRGDPGTLGPLTTAQFLSIPMVLLAMVWWVIRKKAGKDQDPV